MKKIEERMVAAIKSEKPFRESNTEVSPAMSEGVFVFLFGNCIARIIPSKKRIDLQTCGWDTVTTTSRMNAILGGLTDGAFHVTCRTYDKTMGKECRLVQCASSDWNVNLMKRFDRLRGTTVPPMCVLHDLVRYNLEGAVDKFTYVLAKPSYVMLFYHDNVIANVYENAKAIYVNLINAATREFYPHLRGAVARINVLLRAKTQADVRVSIKNGHPVLVGESTERQVILSLIDE